MQPDPGRFPLRCPDAHDAAGAFARWVLWALPHPATCLGTIPSADLATRAATRGTVDLGTAGSGNPGGANALAVLGPRWGYAVMAADIGKGAAACRVGRRLAGSGGAHLAGTASVVGHCFPVWTRFRGGKGVGCSVGQCLATFPAYFPIDLGVAAVTASGPWRQRAFVGRAMAERAGVCAPALTRTFDGGGGSRIPASDDRAPRWDREFDLGPSAVLTSSDGAVEKVPVLGEWPRENREVDLAVRIDGRDSHDGSRLGISSQQDGARSDSARIHG